jgi:glycosyltransferase involved in cell wall biosynthesis
MHVKLGPMPARDDRRLPVTVLIPTYNRCAATLRAVRSVRSQRPLAPAEIIVVDDASTDDTAEAVEAAGVRVVRHAENLGPAAARNTGLDAATHAWVALLDSDDEWLPQHLAELWRLRDEHVLVATSHVYVGADPARLRFAGVIGRVPQVIRDPTRIVFPENPIGASAAMFRRDAAVRAHGFRGEVEPAEDFALWLRLLQHGSAVVSPEVGVLYHLHGQQVSRNPGRMVAAVKAVLEEHQDDSWYTRSLMERWRGRMAWDHIRLALGGGDTRLARQHARALFANPQRMLGVGGLLVSRFRERLQVRRMPVMREAR